MSTTSKGPVTIDGYVIDATITEDHNLDSEVSDYPVESGGSVIDNIRPLPITITLESIVSDTPIGRVATARGAQPGVPLDFAPSDEALAVLLAIRDARETVTIEDSLSTWESMAMTSLSIPRDADTGHALAFTATFKQVVVITNNRTTVNVSPPRTTSLGPRKELGTKSTVTFDNGIGIVWHHSVPEPKWSVSEVLGYDPTLAAKGMSGLTHTDGTPLTEGFGSELDAYNADTLEYERTHDPTTGKLLADAPKLGDSAENGGTFVNNADGSGLHSTEPVFRNGDGTWVDSQGTPVAQNPTYGTWYEVNNANESPDFVSPNDR